MTKKEELKNIVRHIFHFYDVHAENYNWEEMNKACGEILKALEQEPCEDCISRQTVLSKIKEVCFSEEWVQFRVDNGSNGQRDFLINYIEQLPPVTPHPNTGHWIIGKYKDTCSHCRCTYPKNIGFKNYCPNCGAKMEGVEE